MARFFYSILYALLTPIFLLVFLVLSRKNSAWRKGWLQRFGWVKKPEKSHAIWLHAASVGEVQACVPLVKNLQKTLPGSAIILTTFTPTGAEQVRRNFGDSVTHYYLPLDNSICVHNFLARTRPTLLVMMERELWPNLLAACEARRIPVLLANARLSEKSLRSYLKFKALVTPMLKHLTLVAVQNRTDGERFLALGLPPERLEVTGSIKFDVTVPEDSADVGKALRAQWGETRTVLALASSHEDEDERLLKLYPQLQQYCPDLLLLLIPRHLERFEVVARKARELGLKVQQRSQGSASPATEVYVADTLGEMLKVLAAADLVLMGGSLIARGGHNPIEPAALGKPVLIGPHYFNFTEIVERLASAGALEVITLAQLEGTLLRLLTDSTLRERMGQAAVQVVEHNRGAVKSLVQHCQTLI